MKTLFSMLAGLLLAVGSAPGFGLTWAPVPGSNALYTVNQANTPAGPWAALAVIQGTNYPVTVGPGSRFFMVTVSTNSNLRLSWAPVAAPATVTVYQGPAPGVYSNQVTTAAGSVTFSNLTGPNYFAAVVNLGAAASAISSEIKFTPTQRGIKIKIQ